jgi:ornithine decarboxylase
MLARPLVSPKIRDYIAAHPELETPVLLLDADIAVGKFTRLQKAMPRGTHHYAIKANPDAAVLARLHQAGCLFEVASVQEIDMCLAAGAEPTRLLYGNPLKKPSEIQTAHARGITDFVFDSREELLKIAAHAPGVRVMCRIATTGKGAVSPLSVKFGCQPQDARDWLKEAKTLGLKPFGVSFHTGSQQLDLEAWDQPIADAAMVFRELAADGTPLSVLNLGGGLPVDYMATAPQVEEFAVAIHRALDKNFGPDWPEFYTENGRYMTGDCGAIYCEAVLVTPCRDGTPGLRWVYLDVGRYGGIVEEKIYYPLLPVADEYQEAPTGEVILAGQTCDCNDVLYPRGIYSLPLNLQSGEKLLMANTGAYTTTYSTNLNGFPYLRSITL